jgi:cell division protein FtsQ
MAMRPYGSGSVVSQVGGQLVEEEKALWPEGIDGVEESPYLRRQKAVPVRRRQLAWSWRWILFFTAVVAPAGSMSYFLTTFVLSSPRFELRSADDIQVIGNQFVSREEVAKALGLPQHAGSGPGVKVFCPSLEAQRKQVEAIAWVRSAALMRVLPNRLVVHLVERTPVAFANMGGHVGLVDSDGVLLEKPKSASFDFPVITGLDSRAGPDDCRARLALYQDFLRQLAEEISYSGWIVSEVDLADAEDLKALLVQGRDTLQVHFGHESFLEHFRTFLAVLPELRRSNLTLDCVDLRYQDRVVVNPQPRAPAPPAGGLEASQTLKE